MKLIDRPACPQAFHRKSAKIPHMVDAPDARAVYTEEI